MDATTDSGTSDSGEVSTTDTPTTDPATTDDTTAGPGTSDTDEPDPCTVDSDCPETTQICSEGMCIEDPEICWSGTIANIPYTPPNFLLVLDKSTSMFDPQSYWDHDGDDLDDDGFQDDDPMQMATPKVSRWYTARDLVTHLQGATLEANYGATLFPSLDAPVDPGPAGCVVEETPEVPTAEDNLPNILDNLPPADAMGLGGGSPATQALQTAYGHLQPLTGTPIAILLTDGVPDCAATASPDEVHLYDEAFIPTIEQSPVTTMIMGIEISSEPDEQGIVAHDVLHEAALAGGSPSPDPDRGYYDARDLDGFADLFFSTGFTIVECTFELEDPPPEGSTLEVLIADQWFYELSPDADCALESGIIVDTMAVPFTVELCGDACELFKDSNSADFIARCELP